MPHFLWWKKAMSKRSSIAATLLHDIPTHSCFLLLWHVVWCLSTNWRIGQTAEGEAADASCSRSGAADGRADGHSLLRMRHQKKALFFEHDLFWSILTAYTEGVTEIKKVERRRRELEASSAKKCGMQLIPRFFFLKKKGVYILLSIALHFYMKL